MSSGRWTFVRWATVLLFLAGLVVAAAAQEVQDSEPNAASTPGASPAPSAAAAVRAQNGTVIVPDRFLRRWDPVTIFFGSERGPAGGGPEDHPERFVRMTPAHPGAFSWLDARTLRFEPAVAWPALARFSFQVDGRVVRLATLLSPPRSSEPESGSSGLAPIEEVTLTFAEPLPIEALARALVVELRPLPGIGGSEARFLGADDFSLKPLERAAPSEAASYVLRFRQPVPLGTKLFVRFRLSLEDAAERAFAEIELATAEPFRVLRFGCRESQAPAAPAGARYGPEQALACEADDPALVVDFSADPDELTAVVARNFVRVSPAVPELEVSTSGRRLELRGRFERETLYRITLSPTALRDARGRTLELAEPNELWLSFPRQSSYLRLAAGTGLAERFGPRMVPLAGRGDERLDLRIHAIDPLDLSFWPFPEKPVEVDESARPPGPGERPAAWTTSELAPPAEEIAKRIAALGSPGISTLVDLPLRRDEAAATFGLDLSEPLARLSGRDAPGSYLIGVRRLDTNETRAWMRLDVTDLALATVEENQRVVFAVTSLSSAKPVAGAEVVVEGARSEGGSSKSWVELFRGTTGADGRVAWTPVSPPQTVTSLVRRIVVRSGADRLALDVERAPDFFADQQWHPSEERWLQWTQQDLGSRRPAPARLAHLFTERPVYRPDEPVYLKAWLRERAAGRLTPFRSPVILVVEGPGNLVWRYPRTPNAHGAIDLAFDEKELPSGSYRAYLEPADGTAEISGRVSFRKEAYRLPRFEVRLDGPERAALDREFTVAATASYYAGGRVAARPIDWRVTQFPFDWTPKALPGFFFSSDARFARDRRFESTPTLERAETTDEDGGARLTINPAIEPTAQPRTYVVEATVVDADDQTVTATRQIVAVPPLLVGLKVPRYLERATVVRPEIVVLGPDEKPLAGQSVKVRLIHRQWHSYLRASDFSDGVARYVTEVVEKPAGEITVVSAATPVTAELPLPAAGVFVVEVEAHDRLGRAQTVAIDLFAGGDEPVTWAKPGAAIFQIVPDAARYAPGRVAKLVLESPFQNGEALVAVEAPEGNRYSWLPVQGGKAVFELPIEEHWAPKIPVHVLLHRGRLAETKPVPGSATDLGRPTTFGATVWLEVEPKALRVDVALSYPRKARPRQTIDVGIELKDPDGAPLAGEVTLWLVDQAVLALGKEQRLDPVPSFLTAMRSVLRFHDTRSLVFGFLPFARQPGGGEGEEARGILDRQTIRKNFQPVPFYDPSIEVGPDGVVHVSIELADDLTNFELRAKAAAGDERFGFATGHLEVRQPVVLQPALPRFVRPGDRFLAGAVGRIVEGEGGAGKLEARVEGLTLEGEASRPIEWVTNRASRVDLPLSVPTPGYDAHGKLAREEVVVRMGAERASDGAGDAFEIHLPIRDDRDRVRRVELQRLEPGTSWTWSQPAEPARAGTFRRKLLASSEPGIVELAAGLDFLLAYPYGCTEQRVATTRAEVALARLRDLLGLDDEEAAAELRRAVADTVQWLGQVQRPNGLFAFWPGGEGSVALTAWSVELLADAGDAQLAIDEAVRGKALVALEQALRSDYGGFVDGESWSERSWALRALARSGKLDPAYANELARRAELLDLENVAGVVFALDRGGQPSAPAAASLEAELWRSITTRLHQGREIYGGLAERRRSRDGRILPSETRTLAEMIRALTPRADTEPEREKLSLLIESLVALGKGDGWGSTNANAAAIQALAERIRVGTRDSARHATFTLRGPSGERTVELGSVQPSSHAIWTQSGANEITVAAASTAPVALRAETSYVPAEDGRRAVARREGFVVDRSSLFVAAKEGAPPSRIDLTTPGIDLRLTVGQVVEEHVRVVNPADRNFVAIVVPLAAGMEPLNPALDTAPPEAKPAGEHTLEPTYADFRDDAVAYYFDTLPKGTYDFYFRTRAQLPGDFVQPSAKAEAMYDASVVGTSPGASVVIERPAATGTEASLESHEPAAPKN